MFTFDTTNLEQHIAYVAASAIDMATGTRYGRLLWRAADAVLEFDGATANAALVEIAARRAGWVCERVVCGECVAWRMQAAPMDEADEPQQLGLWAA
jgi:hypothetical protein